MATTSKDFRVKHGVNVAGNGYFGGTISVADEPTLSNHVATKAYVDTLANNNNTPVGPTAPSAPSNGGLWLDTASGRLRVYYDGVWMTLAAGEDALTLQDHVHDTSIDGDGRVDTIFRDSSQYNTPQIASISGGTPFDTVWDVVFDGGLVEG
jgi:hypothetical protein